MYRCSHRFLSIISIALSYVPHVGPCSFEENIHSSLKPWEASSSSTSLCQKHCEIAFGDNSPGKTPIKRKCGCHTVTLGIFVHMVFSGIPKNRPSLPTVQQYRTCTLIPKLNFICTHIKGQACILLYVSCNLLCPIYSTVYGPKYSCNGTQDRCYGRGHIHVTHNFNNEHYMA